MNARKGLFLAGKVGVVLAATITAPLWAPIVLIAWLLVKGMLGILEVFEGWELEFDREEQKMDSRLFYELKLGRWEEE